MPMKMLLAAAVAAQGVVTVPGTPAAKLPIEAQPANPDGEDSAEKIAEDAAGDLKDSRLYNKPGATRAEYDRDWQACRQIARGSINPSGRAPIVTYYNPAVISPLAAGIGAGLGGLIGGMIAAKIEKDRMRRANRRACLLIRGWRLVEVDEAERQRVAAFSDGEREAYFNKLLGAETVKGEITTWDNSYAAPQLAAGAAQ
jgi:hypothetical protein